MTTPGYRPVSRLQCSANICDSTFGARSRSAARSRASPQTRQRPIANETRSWRHDGVAETRTQAKFIWDLAWKIRATTTYRWLLRWSDSCCWSSSRGCCGAPCEREKHRSQKRVGGGECRETATDRVANANSAFPVERLFICCNKRIPEFLAIKQPLRFSYLLKQQLKVLSFL